MSSYEISLRKSHNLDRVADVVREKLKEHGKQKKASVFVQREYDISLGIGEAIF